MKEPWDMVCELNAMKEEAYANGKTDRYMYCVCSLSNPGSPEPYEAVGVAGVEEVNTRASESDKHGGERARGAGGTERERQRKREREGKAETIRG